MNDLERILEKYNINGVHDVCGTDKATAHSYCEPYIELLSKYKDLDVDLLEIGMCFGGSILLWQKYLPKSKIYSIDNMFNIRSSALKYLDMDRWQWHIGDAYTSEAVKSIKFKCSSFDIIIDDGPHSIESQISSINLYLPLLKSSGVFIIEDIQDIDKNEYLLINTLKKYPGFEYKTIDLRDVKGRYDDVLFVIYNNN